MILNESYKEAEEIYETLIRIFPHEYEVWIDYSTMYSEQKAYDNALEIMQTALFYLPDCHQINYRIAAILIKLKQHQQAVTFLENALKKNFIDHDLMFIFEPKFKRDKQLTNIINQYKK